MSGFQLDFLVAAGMIAACAAVMATLVRREHVELIDLETQPALAA